MYDKPQASSPSKFFAKHCNRHNWIAKNWEVKPREAGVIRYRAVSELVYPSSSFPELPKAGPKARQASKKGPQSLRAASHSVPMVFRSLFSSSPRLSSHFPRPPPPPCMVRKPLGMELEPSKLDIELAASGGSCPQTLDPMAECLASPKRAFQCFGYHSSVTISVSSGIGDLALCRQQEL